MTLPKKEKKKPTRRERRLQKKKERRLENAENVVRVELGEASKLLNESLALVMKGGTGIRIVGRHSSHRKTEKFLDKLNDARKWIQGVEAEAYKLAGEARALKADLGGRPNQTENKVIEFVTELDEMIQPAVHLLDHYLDGHWAWVPGIHIGERFSLSRLLTRTTTQKTKSYWVLRREKSSVSGFYNDGENDEGRQQFHAREIAGEEEAVPFTTTELTSLVRKLEKFRKKITEMEAIQEKYN